MVLMVKAVLKLILSHLKNICPTKQYKVSLKLNRCEVSRLRHCSVVQLAILCINLRRINYNSATVPFLFN